MKKINLIKRLWTDSHEKQKMGGMRRYAAMLMMLLTLGVGQMWAASITSDGTKRLYFNVNTNHDWWKCDNMFGYFYNCGSSSGCGTSSWSTKAVQASGDIYYVNIPSGTWQGVILTRNSSSSPSWSNKWNQSGDITLAANDNYISAFTENSSTVTWSDYAATPAIIGSMNSWNATTNVFSGSSGSVTCSISLSANTVYEFKVITGTTYYGYGSTTGDLTYVGQSGSTTLSNSGQNIRLATAGAGTYTFTYNCTSHTLSVAYPTVTHPSSDYVYFKKPAGWSTANVKAHVFTGSTAVDVWPGPQISYFTFNGTNYYYAALGDKTSIIFSKSGDTSTKTGDITNASTNKGKWYDTSSSSWKAFTVSITYKDQGGDAFSGTQTSAPTTHTYGIETTLKIPTKTGYTFGGWFTSSDCSTGAVGNTSSAALGATDYTANITLYAKWTEITLTEVSASPSTGGTGVQSMTVSFKTNVPRNSGYYYRVAEFGGVDAGTTGGGFHSNGNLISTGDAATLITSGSFSTINFATSGVYTSAIEIYTVDPITVQKRVTFTYGAGNYYTVSFDLQGHGSDIDNQVILSGDYAEEPDSPSETGYTFGGWYKEAACTNAWNFSTETVTANKTLFAKWTANQYTITFDKESGTGGDNNVTVYYDATLGAFASAPTRTGYTFAGYWTGDNGTGTMLFAANGAPQASVGSYTDGSVKWIYAGNPTVYAKWTENTVTVSPTNHYDAGNPGYSAPTASNSGTVGIVSTSQLVAPAPGTGYTFAGWTLSSNLVVTSGNAATDRTITVRTNGDGNAVSATANYNEDLTSRWHLVGNSSDFPDGWNVNSTTMMQKKTGHSIESAVYFTVNVTSTDTKEFKVVDDNGASSDIWYGYSTGSTYHTWTATSTKNVYTGDGNGNNLKYTPTVTGPYEFKVDYSGAYPAVTITYPTAYTVTYGVGTGYSSMGSVSTSPSVTSGNYVREGSEIAFTATPNLGYKFVGWYREAACTNEVSTDNPYEPTISETTTLYAKFAYRDLYIHADWLSWGTAQMTQSTVNRAIYTYEIDNVAAAATSASAPYNNGYHFRIMNANNGGDGYLAYNYNGVQTPTGSGFLSNSDIHLTDVGNPTIQYNLTHKSKITITLTLQSVDDATKPTVNIAADRYYDIDYTAPSNGSYTIQVGSAVAVSADTEARAGTTITLANTPNTGYTFGSWTVAKSEGTVTVSNNQFSMPAEDVTVSASFTPNTYTVRFHRNGGAGDVVNQDFTYDATQNLTANTYTKTGYSFAGWALSTDGAVTYADEASVSNLTSENGATFHLYAKWTANPYTVTLDVEEENKGTTTGATTSQSVTYDGATTTVPNRPTAANGYALDGYYTDQLGEGTKVINGDGTWIASVAGYTDGDAKWVHVGDVTLYAYYKKAEITNLVAEPGVIAPSGTVTITPAISPTPTGTTKVCYELQYSNGTPLPSQPEFSSAGGNAVSFTAPAASATYIIQATLETGDYCGNGTELSTRTTTFQVAGEHTVTVRYQDSDGRTLAASEEIAARPLTWTTDGDIMPPTITGYTFVRWDAGDGVTIKNGDSDPVTTTTTSSIQIKAVYDGTLTAVYNKKNMIFFNNTLGWDDVYVYFYTSDKYWDNSYGTGAYKGKIFDYNSQFWDMHYGQMTQIEGTDIWYFDYTAQGWDGWANVAFANMDKAYSGEDNTSDNAKAFFSNTTSDPIQVVRRGDHKTSLPMFVPLSGQTGVKRNENRAVYYSEGYWMNYPENTGYTLKIYSGTTYGTSDQLQEIPFEFTADKTLPMSINVELNAGKTYGFEIHRADGTVLGENSYTLVSGDSGDGEQTVRVLGTSERSKITTTVAGDYKFTLNFGNSGGYNYLIGVHYPVVTGDYRILYTDDATWSQGAHTGNYSWWHESRTIHKENGATDIVSFYVKKDNDTEMKFQYASSINASTGVVTWTDVPSGNIDLSSITKDSVYNFYLTQADGGISVSKIEPYTGNYYIRTDCAGATRWENFRTTDHQMTYSDYAEANSGYSHYYTHWVTSGTNVKFCIANDYSMCITDTLTQDYGTVIANIDAAGALNSASANIRFMWNQATNKISRAYIGGSSNISDRFLVLEGDSKMYDKDGSALNISGLNPNEANLIDDQNFVYEREIQVNTKARAKLTAKYNTNIQYFKGSEGAFAEGTTIELLGGDADGKHTMRIVYDFKTNRLVTAYVPSGTIDAAIAINADLMIVREHQGAGQQLLFEGDGALSEVHTVYGVMRFNRWTLNNKEKTGEHSPVGDPKSIYERSLYWISFPFDVNLSDVFGFGTYGVDWIIEYYDGAERATNGYWIDSDGFWKMVMPAQRADFTLEAGKGYVLAIDVDAMKDNNTTFWANNIEQVELFFPSAVNVENITQTTAHTIVPEHECTIDRRTDKSVNNINKDRTKADSHWNMIGVPSYANYNKELTDGSSTITWHNPETEDLPFLYEWNMTDDSYTVQSGTSYPFKAMHSYMVQYHGDLYWSLASATPTPSPIVARRAYAEKPQNAEFRLELQQNEKMVDQTFVKLSNDENVSTNFAFDEDLCKEYNANKANIYTIVENYLPAAGNTLPMSEQTTLVPVGVKIAADGEYTFAIPEGTEGIGVVLIDNIAGTRTNLGLMDYSVTLEQGQIDNRFLLEISPIVQSPTGIELLNGENGENGVRKVLIDNILYIVKDGIVYDAQGHRVQ